MQPKFRTEQDKEQFLLEAGNKETAVFLKNRQSLIKKMVNFRKSQRSKQSWIKNRFKYMVGIRKFHRSIQGKRFHRQLSRFMLTRLRKNEMLPENREAALTAISSLRTHLYLEKQYFLPIKEATDFEEVYNYAIPILLRVEKKLFNYKELDENETELLLRFINPREFIKELSESEDAVELTKTWNWNKMPEESLGLTETVIQFLNGEKK